MFEAIPFTAAIGELGEAPCWDGARGLVCWGDVAGGLLHAFDPATSSDAAYPTAGTPTAVVPASDGRVIVAVDRGCQAFDVVAAALVPIIELTGEPPTNRTNDGKCDPAGRLWIGTMAIDARPRAGSLYRIDRDLSVHRILTEVSISNGLAWSRSGERFFYVD